MYQFFFFFKFHIVHSAQHISHLRDRPQQKYNYIDRSVFFIQHSWLEGKKGYFNFLTNFSCCAIFCHRSTGGLVAATARAVTTAPISRGMFLVALLIEERLSCRLL